MSEYPKSKIALKQAQTQAEVEKRGEVGKPSASRKDDYGKPPLNLLDRYSLEQVASVLAFGAEKYHAHNWRGGVASSRLSAAALRHIFAWLDGENLDTESGLSHLAHAQCCLMFLLRLVKDKPELDDRYKGEGR